MLNQRNTKSLFSREIVFISAKFKLSPLSQVFFSKTLPQCFYYRRRRAADYGATTSRTPFSKPRIRSNNNKIHLARPYNLFYKDTSAYPQQNTTKYRGILLSHLPTCTTVWSSSKSPQNVQKVCEPSLVTPHSQLSPLKGNWFQRSPKFFFVSVTQCHVLFDFPEKIPLFLVATFRMVPQNCMPSWVKWKNK